MTDEDKPKTDQPAKAEAKASAPTECIVCSRRLNDDGFCQFCGYQQQEG
jgi:hypothetical protein